MSLATWGRFTDFCVDVIALRSLFDAATLVNIILHLDEPDQTRVLEDLSQRLLLEDIELYRWFFLEVVFATCSSEQKADMAEKLNLNIATIQKFIQKNENNKNQ